MSKTFLCVLINPVAGREDEFNRWYRDVHHPETVAAGMPEGSLTRYEAAPVTPGRAPAAYRYAMVYDLGDDPMSVLEKMDSARGSYTLTDSLDPSGVQSWVYREMEPEPPTDAPAR